ncbi:MFS transporter [Pollutimonas sp. M17]|uniref:MFS transporter n=1 Tax=Pollutimonas sp. M17 TaxID=2962065 RepID=UPI0021F43A66|nr:MFS transporter [Pollutimonas sp. M17]UYO93272.1 MFS transporter [Pollutimonas sp. M17]
MHAAASRLTPFLNRWGGFMAVAFALTMGFATSSLPSPLYPIYQADWRLQPSELTYIYSLYMAGVLTALLCLGRLSDTLSRYTVVCTSLVLMTLGLLLSGVASGINALLFARGVIGLANGLLTTAGAFALADTHPGKDRRVASVATSASIAVGVGLGPLLSGLLAQTGVAPLRLPYFVVAALALCNLWLTWRSRHTFAPRAGARARLSITPKLALPGKATRAAFLLAGAAAFTQFAAGSLLASLVPSFLYNLLPWKGPAVPGIAFLILSTASAATQLWQRNIAAAKGLVLGLLTLAGCLLALCLGIWTGSAWAFLITMIMAGAGQGLCFMASTLIAGQNADESRRSANMATYFSIAYIGASIPVIAVGRLADHWGLAPAVIIFSALAVLALALLAWLARNILP